MKAGVVSHLPSLPTTLASAGLEVWFPKRQHFSWGNLKMTIELFTMSDTQVP